jgi:hypothetical protein
MAMSGQVQRYGKSLSTNSDRFLSAEVSAFRSCSALMPFMAIQTCQGPGFSRIISVWVLHATLI